jgi:hypothetical protein
MALDSAEFHEAVRLGGLIKSVALTRDT